MTIPPDQGKRQDEYDAWREDFMHRYVARLRTTCRHCRFPQNEHVDGTKCPFAPSQFKPIM